MGLKKKFAIVTGIVGIATLSIHITNRVISYISTLDNNLNNNKGMYFDWRFGKIHYNCVGKGEPVLLIHDLTHFSSSYEWNKIVGKLAQTNKVYTVDLLGCGRSDKPNITYTNFLYIQLINDFIKDVIGVKTNIIASCNSASIPIMSVGLNDTLIDKIIIINPNDINEFSKSPSKRSKTLKNLINTPIIGTFLYNISTTKTSLKRKFKDDFYCNSDLVVPTEIKAYYEAAHLGGLSSKYLFASIKGNYLNTNIVHMLKNINTSIYLIASDNSPNYLTCAEQYKKYMPSIEIFSSSETKKYPQLENPEQLLKQILLILE